MRRQRADGRRQDRGGAGGGKGPAPIAGWVLLIGAVLTTACGERREVAELAAGVAPFEALRGIDAVGLRSGGVRAFRRGAVPAPSLGLQESIGGFDVGYEVPGFDGSDGSWPNEDALVASIEATRRWPSDSSARAAFDGTVAVLQQALGLAPRCLTRDGEEGRLLVAQWERGGGWVVTVSLAPTHRVAADSTIPARHGIAVRREALALAESTCGPE